MEKVEGSGSAMWQLQNGHEDVKYRIGNLVNSTVITMYCVGWVLDSWGGYFLSYVIV